MKHRKNCRKNANPQDDDTHSGQRKWSLQNSINKRDPMRNASQPVKTNKKKLQIVKKTYRNGRHNRSKTNSVCEGNWFSYLRRRILPIPQSKNWLSCLSRAWNWANPKIVLISESNNALCQKGNGWFISTQQNCKQQIQSVMFLAGTSIKCACASGFLEKDCDY